MSNMIQLDLCWAGKAYVRPEAIVSVVTAWDKAQTCWITLVGDRVLHAKCPGEVTQHLLGIQL